MTTLIIARHGNTFAPGDTVRWVGGRTDMPLVESGRMQARNIGFWLKDRKYTPEIVYASKLRRTFETAEIALPTLGARQPVFTLDIFNEIDYGPDENKTNDEIIGRIGQQALTDWAERSIVPPGWYADPDQIIANWKNFAAHIVADEQDCIFVVTSNGIARFAPHITGDYEGFLRTHAPKISTGAVCVFEHADNAWHLRDWNFTPK